jgi:hypothetical protein
LNNARNGRETNHGGTQQPQSTTKHTYTEKQKPV